MWLFGKPSKEALEVAELLRSDPEGWSHAAYLPMMAALEHTSGVSVQWGFHCRTVAVFGGQQITGSGADERELARALRDRAESRRSAAKKEFGVAARRSQIKAAAPHK